MDAERKKYDDHFANSDIFRVKSIANINHNPHPFTIGAEHVKDAADNHGGMLGQATINKLGCSVNGCKLSPDEHTSNKVLFLQLKRNANQTEANKELKPLVPMLKADGIEGLVFVDTDEKFRVQNKKSTTKTKTL